MLSAYNGNISSNLKVVVKRKVDEVSTSESIKTKINISEKNIKIIEGGSRKIEAKLEPVNSNEVINWQSENTSVARVNKNGMVQGIKEGTTNIIASLSNGEAVICKVEVEKEKEIELKGIEIDGSSFIEININERKKLSVKYNPTNASNQKVTWKSSNENVAKVSDDGEIIPIKDGIANITVKSFNGKYQDLVQVKVKLPETIIGENSIKFERTTESIVVGKTKTLVATVLPTNATNKNVTWKSSNPLVAAVENGLVRALKEGETIITATTVNKKISATINIKVTSIKVNGVNIIENNLTMLAGETETLNATVTPENATNKKINWTSSNTNLVTIDQNGKIIACAEGTATITAKTNDGGYEDRINVTVKSSVVLVNEIQPSKSSLTLEKGKSENINVTILPSNATNKNFTCESSNTIIANASISGSSCNITGVTIGTAKVTVYSHDKQKSAVINVTVEDVKNIVNINVATWNIHRYKDVEGKRNLLSEKMASLNLDIVGLQETRIYSTSYQKELEGSEKALLEIGKPAGLNYKNYTHTPAGNGTLSKKPIIPNATSFELEYCGGEARRLQKAVININNVNVSFYNTHLSYLSNCPQIQLQSIYNIIKNDANPIILVGDFNLGQSPSVINNTLGPDYKIIANDTMQKIYADSIIINGKGKLKYVEGSAKTIATKGTLSDHHLVMATVSVIN